MARMKRDPTLLRVPRHPRRQRRTQNPRRRRHPQLHLLRHLLLLQFLRRPRSFRTRTLFTVNVPPLLPLLLLFLLQCLQHQSWKKRRRKKRWRKVKAASQTMTTFRNRTFRCMRNPSLGRAHQLPHCRMSCTGVGPPMDASTSLVRKKEARCILAWYACMHSERASERGPSVLKMLMSFFSPSRRNYILTHSLRLIRQVERNPSSPQQKQLCTIKPTNLCLHTSSCTFSLSADACLLVCLRKSFFYMLSSLLLGPENAQKVYGSRHAGRFQNTSYSCPATPFPLHCNK